MPITYTDALPRPAGFHELMRSTGWFADTPPAVEELAAALAQSWAAVSAYDGPRLVGTGRVLSDGVLHALIVEMIVLPDYQGQGIGSTILTRLVARCRAAGIRMIQLFCARDKAGFYERHGFVQRDPAAPGMELPFT